MKRNFVLSGLLAGAALVLAVGCQTTVNRVEPGQPVAQKQALMHKVVVSDQSLHDKVRVQDMNFVVGTGGLMKVQLEVQNLTQGRHTFSYRVEWFDEKGMIITLPTQSAISRTLEGQETASITATAPNDQARDFRIKLLEAAH
jgi:uncharacterized protein YcfL